MEAAKAGVLLHGAAGDAAAEDLGTRSILAGDLPAYIPQVLAET
jgi:NAD(P)H-hydrate repair Nnr-like enzyme with NAD(P)H-hydrate dehydratase domain